MDNREQNGNFLDQLDAQFEGSIQEAELDVPAVEIEYRRALSDSKILYNGAQEWKPIEHSNRFRDTLGRLLGVSTM